jgi:putative CocE/NonD family hydrolase
LALQAYEVFGIHPVVRTNVKNVTFYVMSSNDEAGLSTANYWTTMDAFPTPKMTRFYAHADGSASTVKPSAGETESTSYVYDPKDPVPTVGGSNLDMPCGPLDQAEIDQRSDVLVFQTPVMDEPMYMTGPLFANLFVGSDAIDTDFMVRISDVYPTGEARLIQDSAVRMRWREGGLTPVYMESDKVYEVTASLWNTSYVIAPGHAVRFAVTSSNYPRFSLNPNNGELLIQNSTSSPVYVANNVLYHSAQYPSNFVLPVVQKHQLPVLHDIKLQFQKAYPQVDLDELLKSKPTCYVVLVVQHTHLLLLSQ